MYGQRERERVEKVSCQQQPSSSSCCTRQYVLAYASSDWLWMRVRKVGFSTPRVISRLYKFKLRDLNPLIRLKLPVCSG